MNNLEERERELNYVLNGIRADSRKIHTDATRSPSYIQESIAGRARRMVRDVQFSVCDGNLESAIELTALHLDIPKSRVRAAVTPRRPSKRQLESMERTALRAAASYARKATNFASAAQLKMDFAKRLRAEIEGKPDPDFYTP